MTAIMFVGKISIDGGPPRPATMSGDASQLGIWGGPIDPYPDHGLPGAPPGIWGGGNVPMPNPPIANVPGAPGYRPPGDHIWGGGNVPMPSPPIANVPGAPGWPPVQPPLVIWGPSDPRPDVPIYWPGYPNWPPTEPSPEPPPADRWTWQYSDDLGWVLVPPGSGGKPQPVP